MKKKLTLIYPILLRLLFVALLLVLLAGQGLYNLDPDLPWHLKFGQDTWLTKQLPREQIHLWSIPDGTWVDHEWLTNVGMYAIYQQLGYNGLNLFFALIALLTLLLIAGHLKKINPRAEYFIMALMLLSYFSIRPHLGPRPQIISLLFLALEFLILLRAYDWHRFKTVFFLGALFWLWACLHAGFLIGLMVLALWAGEQIIIGWRTKNPRQFWLGLEAGCLSFVVTLLTPYGFKLYDFLSSYTNNAYLAHINEWKAFYVFPVFYWQLLFIALVVALGVSLWFLNKSKPRLPIWQWLSLFLFLGLALKSARHFPLFFVTAGLLFFPAWLKAIALNDFVFPLPKWAKPVGKIIFIAGLSSLLVIGCWYLPKVNDPFQSFCDYYPCQAARQLQTSPRYSQLKLFNQYAYGGWLIWVWPDKQLFVDGRLPQYPLAGHSLLEEYLEFTNRATLKKKLQDYGVEAIIWNNHPIQYKLNWLDKFLGFNERDATGRPDELKIFLDSSPDWQAVFKDEASTVYVRKDKL